MEETAEAFTAGVLVGYGHHLAGQEEIRAANAGFNPAENSIVATQALGISLGIAEALDQFEEPDEFTLAHEGAWLSLHLANALQNDAPWAGSLEEKFGDKKSQWQELAKV